MSKLFEVATQVSTPLALAGLVATSFFLIVRQALANGLFPKFARQVGAELLRSIIDKFFILAIVAMCLGFFGFALVQLLQAKTATPEETRKRNYEYHYQHEGKDYVGYFKELEANSWVEFTKEAGRDLTYYFREIEGEPGWITLYDSGRGSYVRLRADGGWCQYATAPSGPWYNIHKIVPANGR